MPTKSVYHLAKPEKDFVMLLVKKPLIPQISESPSSVTDQIQRRDSQLPGAKDPQPANTRAGQTAPCSSGINQRFTNENGGDMKSTQALKNKKTGNESQPETTTTAIDH